MRLSNEETEVKKFLVDSITLKNEFHVEEEPLRNETEGETYLSRVKKRARKIKKKLLMGPLKKKKKLEVNFLRKIPLHARDRLARKTRK